MSRFLSLLSVISLLAALNGCSGKGENGPIIPDEGGSDPVPEITFARGADISWVSEMESAGIKFKDSKGERDILKILKDLGMNSIRLRVWVDPIGGTLWSGQKDVAYMAKRAFDEGMAVMVDFHYSDFFADPGRQTIPSSWSVNAKLTDKVASSVATHTASVLNALKAEGVTPAWVQVGNETNNGMVWDAGKIDWDKSGSSRYADYVIVSNAGYDAVKQVFPNVPVIVHIANAFSAGDYDGWFFKEFKQAGGKFDIIGLSHYPMSESGKTWSQMNSLAVASVKTLATKQSCPVMICEVGVKSSSSEAGVCMKDFMDSLKSLGGGVCAGVFYWEPEVDGKWKPAIYGRSGLICEGWAAYDMGAFSSSGSVFSPITSILSCFSQ